MSQTKLDHSPELRACMDEITALLKKYDVMGAVSLHDGLGMSEFAMLLDVPSWSSIESNANGIRLKIPAKSEPGQGARVVNAIWSMVDVLWNMHHRSTTIKANVNKYLNVESQPGVFKPRI